ncbi:MAG: cyclic nucleotide-binding domain-containing protein, partial [Deltaproteobacteria bacterium]|nr:cyclic nucleotide-binding domain-containing protein [Deltaproteobacteria bacterium]
MPAEALTQATEEVTISPVQRALIIKTFPGFVSLSAAELAVMASVVRERFFPAGSVLLEPGTPVVAFHLVVEGEVQMHHGGRPTQKLGPRSSVGGLGALTRDPRGAHAVALEDTITLEIDTDDMQDVFEDNFNILMGVMRTLSRTVREFQKKTGGGAASGGHQTFEGLDTDQPLTLVDRMFFIRKASSFARESIEALAEFAAHAVELRLSAGDRLWAIGDPPDHSALIVNGVVECRPEDMDPFDLGPGFVVGGPEIFIGEPRWYEAVAKTDVILLK